MKHSYWLAILLGAGSGFALKVLILALAAFLS
jgi:hypothetical protein